MSRDALVVGINTYQSLPSLKAPAKDAEAIATQLQTQGEFRVHRLPEVIQSGQPMIGQKTQATLRELETALIQLFKPKGSNIAQTALFYFSGHGIQREAGIREGYLALSDSQPEKGFYGLSLFWLRRLLQESPVRQRIIILDCCHSGELLNFLEADPGARPGTDRLFMAASREYETAFESLDSPYSVFTQAILKGLDPASVESGIVTNHSLINCVSHALKGEIQQPLFESSGSEMILTRSAAGAARQPRTIKSSDICPYRGLECFDEAHAEYFFGREKLTTELIQKLKTDRFVAVVGASGIGKSSLVRAGMMAQLRQEQTQQGEERWRMKLLTPTSHPLKSLATAFLDPHLTELERAEQLRRAEAFLQAGGAGFAQLVRASLPIDAATGLQPATDRPRLLLVIDQFEELFTLSQSSHAEQERQLFFDCLLGAAEQAQDCLSIVIVLRQDFLTKCSLHERLAHKLEHHQLMVAPLKYEQIKAAILHPAQKVGLVCEPHLIYTMLLDVSGAPGELPLLQYTLTELWQHRRISTEGGIARLTLEAYQELGGVRGTLQKRATEVFHRLTPEEQTVAKRIFLALTQLGEGTEDTRRRVMKSELVAPAYPIELVEQVLEQLVAAKLVVAGQDVDVVHESLIRNWILLRDWLKENREMLRRLRRIEQSAQEWAEAGRPSVGDCLLGGLRLRDAEDFLKSYSQELSTLAQELIIVSREEVHRARRETRQLQIAVPSVLLTTLVLMLGQYHNVLNSQAEKEQQLNAAIARERAAIAQSILQEEDTDPTTALLISRLAAQGVPSSEVQSSLRSALQHLRLQLELRGHTGAIHQVAFSPDRHYLASASADGTIRLWALDAQTIYNTHLEPSRILLWSTSTATSPTQSNPSLEGFQPCQNLHCSPTIATNAAAADIISMAFSPNGQHLAAIAQDSPMLKVWSVETGAITAEIAATAPVTQVAFSPDGAWIVSVQSDQTIAVFTAQTGQLLARIPLTEGAKSVQFSPDGQSLLVAGKQSVRLLTWTVDAVKGLQFATQLALPLPANLHQASFSPSGRSIATATVDGSVRLWDRTTGRLLHTLTAPRSATAPTSLVSVASLPVQPTQMRFTPSEQTLIVLDTSHHLQFWDLATGQLRQQVSIDRSPPPDASTPDQALLNLNSSGQLLVTTDSQPIGTPGSYAATLWDVQTGQSVGRLLGHGGIIEAAQFSPDGTYVVTASADGTLRLWATEPGGELPTLQLPDASVQWAMFMGGSGEPHPVEPSLSSSLQESVQPNSATAPSNPLLLSALPVAPSVWRVFSLDPSSPPPVVAPVSSGLAASAVPSSAPSAPDPVTAIANLVTVTLDGKLQRWQILTELESGLTTASAPTMRTTSATRPPLPNLLQRLSAWLGRSAAHPAAPAQTIETPPQVAASPSPAVVSFPVQLAIGSSTTPRVTATNPLEGKSFSSVALSASGHWMASADSSGKISVYQIQADQSSQLIYAIQNWRSTPNNLNPVSEVQQSSIASAAAKPEPPVTTVPSGSGSPVTVRKLSFSTDNRYLLAIADDFTVRLWDTQTGQLLQVLRGHEASIQQAQFSPDGQWIVTASWDRTARIWQVASGTEFKVLPHADVVNSAYFSTDSQQIVTASWDGTARIFTVETGEPQHLLQHKQAILDAEFSPDGRQVVTASINGSAYLWDATSAELQAELRPNRLNPTSTNPDPVLQASFSPDGQYVATRTEAGKVQLWAATWEMLVNLARERSHRQLTAEECRQYLQLSAAECPVLELGE